MFRPFLRSFTTTSSFHFNRELIRARWSRFGLLVLALTGYGVYSYRQYTLAHLEMISHDAFVCVHARVRSLLGTVDPFLIYVLEKEGNGKITGRYRVHDRMHVLFKAEKESGMWKINHLALVLDREKMFVVEQNGVELIEPCYPTEKASLAMFEQSRFPYFIRGSEKYDFDANNYLDLKARMNHAFPFYSGSAAIVLLAAFFPRRASFLSHRMAAPIARGLSMHPNVLALYEAKQIPFFKLQRVPVISIGGAITPDYFDLEFFLWGEKKKGAVEITASAIKEMTEEKMVRKYNTKIVTIVMMGTFERFFPSLHKQLKDVMAPFIPALPSKPLYYRITHSAMRVDSDEIETREKFQPFEGNVLKFL